MRNIFTVSLLLICVFSVQTISQEKVISNNSFYYPDSKREKSFFHTVGVSTAELPEDLVETDNIFRSPLFFYKAQHKLPLNFLIEAGAESNIITYHVEMGPKWIINFNNSGLSIGTNAAWFYGMLDTEGFNTQITGWHLYPNLSAGYNFPYFAVTLKTELHIILNQTSKVGSIKENLNHDTFAGYSIAAYLEQPLWKNNYVVLGLKFNFTKFYSPLWAVFPTFDRYIYISEIIFGYNI